MFALCTFVETFITRIYGNRSIYFCKPRVLLCWVTPQGSASGKRPRLSAQLTRAARALCSSADPCPCCLHGLLGGWALILNLCTECFYSLTVLL